MEELQAKHRKEAKDLQSRITQKKKGATKKTRKGVNDECDALERELKQQQAQEIAELDPTTSSTQDSADLTAEEMADLTLNRNATNDDKPPSIPPSTAQPTSATPSPANEDTRAAADKKPNRAKARLARRQAEQEALFARAEQEASNLPNQKKVERDRMLSEFRSRHLTEKEIRADGHCLYSAIADQITTLGLPLSASPFQKPRLSFPSIGSGAKKDAAESEEPYRVVRRAAAGYIETHADDFEPFLEEPLGEYVRKIRETGEWGGQLELMALARTYGVRISVLQGDGRVEEITPDEEATKQQDEEKRIWLAYYRHGFGLGEHYNSLHKATAQ